MMTSLLSRLASGAASTPDRKAWTFLDDKGNVTESFTYAELDRSTSTLATHLLTKERLQKGDRVLLVFFPGLHFTAALLACFKAGIIAVPVFPPDPRRLKKDLNHFVSIQSSSGARVALTHGAYNFAKNMAGAKNLFTMGGEKWPEMRWIQVDDVLNKAKTASAPAAAVGGAGGAGVGAVVGTDIAFLQYTSGSTSEPKGVMITHDCLAHNLTLIVRELKADINTINVSWLPQYHDMGLIGSYLGVLYCGGVGYYLSPISFLKDPTVWMKSISKYKGTHTQAPNFAYALSARKFREAGSPGPLDLSSVKHMINAAEPVDVAAIGDFYSIYGAFGLPLGVVIPTYGLAEHSVFVCSGGQSVLSLRKAALEANRVEVLEASILSATPAVVKATAAAAVTTDGIQKIVGCGFPGRGEAVDLIIVDPETLQVCAADNVGEIWVSSPSKAVGYWERPEQTAEEFHAQSVPASSSSDGYLRTGDLGFLREGELFICGRIKDLIIVRGSNHYPQDIERTAEKAQTALRAGCSAAFAIKQASGHTEAVVFVAEIKEGIKPAQLDQIIEGCREAISKDHGLSLTSVCLLQTRSVPKTTSGKITRAGCRKAFLENTLAIVRRWDGLPSDDIVVSKVEMEEGVGNEGIEMFRKEGGGAGGEGDSLMVEFKPEEVRAMSVAEILDQLESTLVGITLHSPSPISSPVDRTVPLLNMGLDSMTVVQFKGVLENKFHSQIPDEYMFSNFATLENLALAAKRGELTTEQRHEFEEAAALAQGADGPSTIMIERREPWCPWFTCCY